MITTLTAGTIIKVHVVITDQVQDHLGGLGDGQGAQVVSILHAVQGTLCQPKMMCCVNKGEY